LILVEAAVESPESALAAERAGADRIELCANLDDGGTTPPPDLIAAVVERTTLPVFVLIRTRAGEFVYTNDEIDGMSRDIDLARTMGAAGIVTGALTPAGSIEEAGMRTLVKAAAGLPVTFHRAFDVVASPLAALEELIALGLSRALTSGGAATASEGADAIAALVDHAHNRIAIVAGGGIREQNVRDVIARTGVREIHTRLIDEGRMRGLVELARPV
jgi:copper homeostasis protein